MSKEKSFFLEPQQLRTALLSFSTSKEKIVDTARIVAAYYLGFPLFIFENENARFPSLFLWTQYAQDGLPNDVQVISREYFASKLPIEYSPRFPIILLNYCNLELESILYSDHFNDRRTALLLRLYIDNQFNLGLANSYITDLLHVSLPKFIALSMNNLSFLNNSLEAFIDSLLELDIILVKDYMIMLENVIIERIEYLFSELPIQASSTENIPRVPVYSTPEKTDLAKGEDKIHLEIHIYIRMLLVLLHRSNRLTSELSKAMIIISESRETKNSIRNAYSIIVRLVLIIVTIIFRDSFSLAVAEQWSELPVIALKYKSLLKDISEDSHIPFSKWYSLATDQDIDHLHLFFEWARENFSPESKLPPLTVFTRDVWCQSLLERADNQRPESAQNDWISGLLIHTNKIDYETYHQMIYISSNWKSFSVHDSSLISIRLALSPSDFCSSKPAPQQTIRRVASAREAFHNEYMNDDDDDYADDKLFTTRDDLAASYSKQSHIILRQQIDDQRKKQKKEARYMKNLHRHGIIEMMNHQMDLVTEINKEKQFLASIDRNSLSSPSTYSRSTSSGTKILDKDDDLWSSGLMSGRAANQNVFSNSSHINSNNEEKCDKKESVDMTSGCEVVDLDSPLFNYNEVEAVTNALPSIEKLDFSILSPLPTIRNRTSSVTSSTQTTNYEKHFKMEEGHIKEKNKVFPTLPDWMKLLPLEERTTDRPQLFQWDSNVDHSKKKNLTDRGILVSHEVNYNPMSQLSTQLNRVNLSTYTDKDTI